MKGSDKVDDQQIVNLYFARNEQAIDETSHKYGKYLHCIAYNILYNHRDSEEAVNDTYLGAWKSIPPHRPQRLNTYLGKITRRCSLEKWKVANAQKRGGGEVPLALEELEVCIPGCDSPETVVEMKELTQIINSFLKTLPDTEQKVFLYRYWYLMPIKAIVKQFGFSESKVKSMLSRSRNKLKMHLQKKGIPI